MVWSYMAVVFIHDWGNRMMVLICISHLASFHQHGPPHIFCLGTPTELAPALLTLTYTEIGHIAVH